MVDRHLLGDIGLAIILAVPTLSLSRPQVTTEEQRVATLLPHQAASADQSTTERRYSLES